MADQQKLSHSASASASLHGDILDSIISHVPLIHLLSAYRVSREWQSAVCHSLTTPSRLRPWLIARIQSSHNPSSLLTLAYDPETDEWIKIPCAKSSQYPCLPIRSSHPQLIYTLTASKLSFSLDPLDASWHEVDGPKISRSDPIVVKLGSSYIAVLGGTYDFEDDPLAVEIYDLESGQWEVSQSMPDVFKCYAASTWLSVAVSDDKMFLLEKHSGTFSAFDSKTKTWGNPIDVRPTGSLFFSLIGYSNGRLVLTGLIGDADNVQGLMIWEVNSESYYCKELGKMPCRMLEQLMECCFSSSSINISMGGDMIYIYNPSNPKTIIACELLSNGSCCWATVESSVANDENLMRRFVFTCSKIGISDLQKAFS